jgi:hypothetical protein
MHREGEEVHIETDEARGGSTPHIMRYVLGISLVLALAAMSLVWIVGASSRDVYPDPDSAPSASASPRAGQG